MPRAHARLLVILIVAALAGCVGSDPAPASEGEPRQGAPGQHGQPAAPAPRPGGDGSHVHDYWNGAAQLTLYNGSVPVTVLHNHMFDEPPRSQHTHSCDESIESTSQGGSVKFALPPGDIVLPGTRHLQVSLAWDAPLVTALRLMYRPPTHDHHEEEHGHDHHGGFSDAGPMANGQGVVVPLTPAMADLGHETRSRWAFFVCADTDEPNLAEGSVRMTIVAHRADELPLDPPHPDHWGGAAAIRLGGGAWSGESWAVGNQGQDHWLRLAMDHGAIVPSSTDRILVTAWLNGTSAGQDVMPGALSLYYKDSTVPDWIYQRVEAAPGSPARFEVPIDDAAMTDSPYAKQSNWDFWLHIASQAQASAPAGLGTWSAPHRFEGSLEAGVVAHRAGG